METIILFKSKTGFTKKYAKWIAEDLNCEAVAINKSKKIDLNKFDTIVFGGGLCAGSINGKKYFSKLLKKYKDKKFVLYATGLTPVLNIKMDKMLNDNFTTDEQNMFASYYFASGLNYKKMGLVSKMLMAMLRLAMKNKNKDMAKSIEGSSDFCKKEYIVPLLNYIK